MYKYGRELIRLAAVFYFASLVSGAHLYSSRVWRTQDGLPQSRIQSFAQTPEDYLWIGTSGGLVRFDGVRFYVFDRLNTPAFQDDSILALLTAKDGSLWIGTEGGGLVHYQRGVFTHFGRKQGLTNLFVRSVLEAHDGRIWVGTDRGFFECKDGALIRQDGRPELPLLSVTTMVQDDRGRIWLGGALGIWYLEGGRFHRHSFTSEARAILHTRKRTTWIATGLGLYTADGDVLRPSQLAKGSNVRQLAEDNEGNLWIGNISGGLLRWASGMESAVAEKEGLPDNTVLAIFSDRQGNVWVGTQDGLQRLTRTLVNTVTTQEGLRDENVGTVYEDPSGTIWITTGDGRLYTMQDGRAASYRLPNGPSTFYALSVFVDSRKVLWLGTIDRGIGRVVDGRATFFTTQDGLRNDRARQFFEDSRGSIWVATGSGLLRWTGDRFQNYYLQDGLAYGGVRVIQEVLAGAYRGDVLIGTDGGLNRAHENRIVPDHILFPGEKIWSILQDDGGAVWIGTRGSGLIYWKGDKVQKFTTKLGLLSNSIYQLLDDRKGRLWMSSPAGIFSAELARLYSLDEGRSGPVSVLPYGTAEGLQSSQMNGGVQTAGFRSSSGELWFPSVKGVVRIDPARVRHTNVPVFIESVVADDELLKGGSVATIPAGTRKLQINYTACNLASPERVSFRYKLEGFDDGWTTASNGRAAQYTNLPPATYRFRVIATDATAAEQPSEAALTVHWKPHVYQTYWFLGACLLALGGLAFGGTRIYAHQTQVRYSVLLAERTRLAREMHDTLIQGCVGISTLLEAASSSEVSHPSVASTLLAQARAQIRLTLDEAREAVWDLRNAPEGKGLAAMLSQFALRLSGQKGIAVESNVTGTEMPLDERTERSLLLVAREAMRNAIAHSEAKRVEVSLIFSPETVRLEVTDDGKGFDPELVRGPDRGHYGLLGMKERVEQIGGKFRVQSEGGTGTTVAASVPLHVRPLA